MLILQAGVDPANIGDCGSNLNNTPILDWSLHGGCIRRRQPNPGPIRRSIVFEPERPVAEYNLAMHTAHVLIIFLEITLLPSPKCKLISPRFFQVDDQVVLNQRHTLHLLSG